MFAGPGAMLSAPAWPVSTVLVSEVLDAHRRYGFVVLGFVGLEIPREPLFSLHRFFVNKQRGDDP